MANSILSRYIDPDVLKHLAQFPFEPKNLVIGNLAGAHKSPLAGFAVEFAGHREYVVGDDPKHLDWRVFFTRDKYFVKQYELETNFVCHLLLDVSASMRYGDGNQQKLLYGAQLATSLGYSIVRQSDKVSFSTFDSAIRGFLPPSNSMDQIVRMTRHLDEAEPVEKTDISDCLEEFSSRTGRREIVLIFSDFFCDLEQLENAVQRMRYNKHEVVLFHVLHNDEREFRFEGMVKFVGLEISEELLTQPDDLREGYMEALQSFNRSLQDITQRNGCELVTVDTSRSLKDTFVDYLSRRVH